MLKKRNAQGLSITTIIIAVVGIIVLLVLIVVFTGKINVFGEGVDLVGGSTTKTCAVLKGTLKDVDKCTLPSRVIPSSDPGPTVCCK